MMSELEPLEEVVERVDTVHCGKGHAQGFLSMYINSQYGSKENRKTIVQSVQ